MSRARTLLGFALLFLVSCSLLKLPFQLVGGLINVVIKLISGILGAGTAAAAQAAKLTPYALLFTQVEPAATPASQETLSQIARACETAPIEIVSLEQAVLLGPSDSAGFVLIDPAQCLEPSARERMLEELGGRKVVGAVWVRPSKGAE